ncbi:DUF6766 family protein [Micromonospora echinofusca]|uniref:DUF6766 family protein n=1 Tax=Micromonospora echinofusca TaxID=47858 RepID=UPI0037A45130
MPRWLRDNALTVTMFGAFLVFLVLQSVFGWQTHNEELAEFGAAPTSWAAYLGSGHFMESVFENWESEFLQMGGYVLLTASAGRRSRSRSPPNTRTPATDGRHRQAGTRSRLAKQTLYGLPTYSP